MRGAAVWCRHDPIVTALAWRLARQRHGCSGCPQRGAGTQRSHAFVTRPRCYLCRPNVNCNTGGPGWQGEAALFDSAGCALCAARLPRLGDGRGDLANVESHLLLSHGVVSTDCAKHGLQRPAGSPRRNVAKARAPDPHQSQRRPFLKDLNSPPAHAGGLFFAANRTACGFWNSRATPDRPLCVASARPRPQRRAKQGPAK